MLKDLGEWTKNYRRLPAEHQTHWDELLGSKLWDLPVGSLPSSKKLQWGLPKPNEAPEGVAVVPGVSPSSNFVPIGGKNTLPGAYFRSAKASKNQASKRAKKASGASGAGADLTDTTTSNDTVSDSNGAWDNEMVKCLVDGCQRGDDGETLGTTMVSCDFPSCLRGQHLLCMQPPLQDVPSGNWYCDICGTRSLSEGTYLVQDIREEKGNKYLIKWWGYPDLECTWQPKKSITDK